MLKNLKLRGPGLFFFVTPSANTASYSHLLSNDNLLSKHNKLPNHLILINSVQCGETKLIHFQAKQNISLLILFFSGGSPQIESATC